jgi:hypothetical protein
MNKEFVSYEQAVALKELGFGEPCLGTYYYAGKRLDISEYINHGKYTVLAPLKQQVLRWFREKYGLIGEIFSQLRPSNKFMYAFKIGGSDIIFDGFDTYEEAENNAIDKLIELAKQQDNGQN